MRGTRVTLLAERGKLPVNVIVFLICRFAYVY
jgi:hypothetical protein